MSQSYSQWVTLSDVASSRSILPVGINENAENEHFHDQDNIWLNLTMRQAPIENCKEKAMVTIDQFTYPFVKKIITILFNNESINTLLQYYVNL